MKEVDSPCNFKNVVSSMTIVDEFLRFLTTRTGETEVSMLTLSRTLPLPVEVSIVETLQRCGVIRVFQKDPLKQCRLSWDDDSLMIGFPEGDLNGSTKKSAKKRLMHLRERLRSDPSLKMPQHRLTDASTPTEAQHQLNSVEDVADHTTLQVESKINDFKGAMRDFRELLGSPGSSGDIVEKLAYAGSQEQQQRETRSLSPEILSLIPASVLSLFSIGSEDNGCTRQLYSHQAVAIESACNDVHTAVCTGTGSGKSLCFWVPVFSSCVRDESCSLVVFPTKALAQDQFSKLQKLLEKDVGIAKKVRPCILDGDTSQSLRQQLIQSSNVILTNPDTIHAAILPNSKGIYESLIERIRFVALDEAHVYAGAFGAHVSLVLRRLYRVMYGRTVTYLITSATLPSPEAHVRRLCPILEHEAITVVATDGSPRAAKHFFVQNPPLLCDAMANQSSTKNDCREKHHGGSATVSKDNTPSLKRRHAADETALWLAYGIMKGIRCIAFCKTRNLVEWVYEKAHRLLRPTGREKLLESYRGGYRRQERREIEAKLFNGDVIGVVATNALELGIDVGGVDLTLHCGYPSSTTSLLQQAGRAGRSVDQHVSIAIMICFNSPSEQHIWKHPSVVLGAGVSESNSIPYLPSLVEAHMLCSSSELPLLGTGSVVDLVETGSAKISGIPDHELFGDHKTFLANLTSLQNSRSISKGKTRSKLGVLLPSFHAFGTAKRSAHKVSLRSIEPVSFAIVNLCHPCQNGSMEIQSESAVLDTISYSRVFYHAHPGAIITHRSQKYKVVAMMKPEQDSHRKELAAFVRPTRERYLTRPLSNMFITVVKTFETIESRSASSSITVAGYAAVSVKRTVHGYKRLSPITRDEISRTELSLPALEYETFGIFIDTGADELKATLGDDYGKGIHALGHAFLAVAPVMSSTTTCRSDLQCSHEWVDPTCLIVFDEQAGGSGACYALWQDRAKLAKMVDAAVDLLTGCAICNTEVNYNGGCPECLHDPQCIKFNNHLSRSAAIVIGKWVSNRLSAHEHIAGTSFNRTKQENSPRRLKRQAALEKAKHLYQKKRFVVGRPSWPMDN